MIDFIFLNDNIEYVTKEAIKALKKKSENDKMKATHICLNQKHDYIINNGEREYTEESTALIIANCDSNYYIYEDKKLVDSNILNESDKEIKEKDVRNLLNDRDLLIKYAENNMPVISCSLHLSDNKVYIFFDLDAQETDICPEWFVAYLKSKSCHVLVIIKYDKYNSSPNIAVYCTSSAEEGHTYKGILYDIKKLVGKMNYIKYPQNGNDR